MGFKRKNFNIDPNVIAMMDKAIDNALEEYTTEIVAKNFNDKNIEKIYNQFLQWKKEYDNLILKMEVLNIQQEHILKMYYAQQDNQGNYQLSLLQQFELQLKKGYAIIQVFRHLMTSQVTKYQLMVSIQKKTLKEYTLEMKDMLKAVNLGTSQNFSDIQNIQELIKTAELQLRAANVNKMVKRNEDVEEAQGISNNLYNSIDKYINTYYLRGVDKNQKYQKYNRGWRYEVYLTLLDKGLKVHTDISQIENDNERQGIYTIIKQIANARNTIKFYQQAGDVGELQAKNLSKSAARLSASTTIRLEIDNILTYLGEYMETKDKEKLKEEIKKNLTVPEKDLSDETEKVLNDEANNAIDMLFENF